MITTHASLSCFCATVINIKQKRMYRHFWLSHQARKYLQNEADKIRFPMSATMATSISHNHEKSLHEHRFKLPTTLRDAYIEFDSIGSAMHHRTPRAMAIT